MKLWAISDLHIGRAANRKALESMRRRPGDWLILAGDIGETETELADAFELLQRRFAKLIWVPGNHELWTTDNAPGSPQATRGEARYSALIALARSYGVVTPEDPYPLWPGSDRPIVIAPLFTLFDYSFRPDGVPAADVVDWAAAEGIVSADESLLDPTPYPDRAAWCARRVESTAARLAALPADWATVLVNHYPLQFRHALLSGMPRFVPWCGTRLTEDWPLRYRALAVVYGHLHTRRSFEQDDVMFHEVSLGYPEQWDQRVPINSFLRSVL
jgi:predicted phosphodiesterase